MDADAGEVPLPEAQGRARADAVDGHTLGGLSRDVDRLPGDGQIVFDRRPPGRYMSKGDEKDQDCNYCGSYKEYHNGTFLSLSELPITEIEIELIAAAAIIGDKKIRLLKIGLLQYLLR